MLGLHCWLAVAANAAAGRFLDTEFLDFRPTLFFSVPTIYVRCSTVEQAREIRSFMRLLSRFSATTHAGARRVSQPDHTILERYGMTET